ncbi:hypothetical protein P4234_12425 [Pseudomonas aeruginosa]|nr:hypothetical protein [Pseudomonas aeruginosa]
MISTALEGSQRRRFGEPLPATRRTSPFCSMSTASASIRRTFAARARTSPSR